MITWEQIRQWGAEPVSRAADDVVAARNQLVGSQSALDAVEVHDWNGGAAEDARDYLARQRRLLEKLAAELGTLAEMLQVTESDITVLATAVEETDQIATTHEFRIEGSTVVDADTNGDADTFFRFFRPMVKSLLDVRVRTLLAAANDIDADLNAVFDGILESAITDGDAGTLAGAAREGQKRIELSEILEDYQTHEERVVKWGWRASPVDPPIFTQDVTESEAKLLDGLSRLPPLELWELGRMYDIREDSGKVALERYPDAEVEDDDNEVQDRTRANAFKHAYWNALMVREYGADWAEKYGTAHERKPNDDPHNEAMDLHNNEVGRRIAEENPDASPEELADLIQEAERNGKLVALDKIDENDKNDENDEIQYSNEL